MSFWDRIGSIADKLKVQSDYGYPQGGQEGDYQPNPYGQPEDYGQQTYGYPEQSQGYYQQGPAQDPQNYDYESSYGSGTSYTSAGVRPRGGQQKQKKGGLGGLFDRLRGGGKQQQPMITQAFPQQQPYYDNSAPPPNNVIQMPYGGQQQARYPQDYDPQQGQAAYDPRQPYDPNQGYGQQDMQEPPREYAYEQAPQEPVYEPQAYEPEPPPAPEPRRPARAARTSPTMIYLVRRLEDAEEIISYMMEGGNVIVNMEDIDEGLKQRVLDMISGAAFALDCSLKRISFRNYFIAPSGEEVLSNISPRERDPVDESRSYRPRDRRY